MHEQIRHRISVQHDRKYLLHCLHFGLIIALFQLVPQLLKGRLVGAVIQMDHGVAVFEEGCHAGQTRGKVFRSRLVFLAGRRDV